MDGVHGDTMHNACLTVKRIGMVTIAGRMEHAAAEFTRGSRQSGSGCEPNPN